MPMAFFGVGKRWRHCQNGNCRVGLEDNLYLDKGEFATNVLLIERAVRIIREVGREPATPSQAAAILGIER